MTANQINYQRHLEDIRSHQVQERETNRANRARETETNRANLKSEELTARRDQESQRHNAAVELETNRSNLARELETNRSNLANETIKRKQIDSDYKAKVYQADSALSGTMYSADQGYAGRTDSAYINQYGVSPTTVKQAVEKVGKVLNSKPVVKAGTSAVLAPAIAGRVLLRQVNTFVEPIKQGVADTFKQLKGGSNNGEQHRKKQQK